MCTYPVQPICTFSCTSVFIFIFINPQYTVLHILSHAHLTPYFILLFVPIFILTILIYIYCPVLCFIVLLPFMLFLFFALSIERTCPDLHFTTDYTLYDCVCDK